MIPVCTVIPYTSSSFLVEEKARRTGVILSGCDLGGQRRAKIGVALPHLSEDALPGLVGNTAVRGAPAQPVDQATVPFGAH
jgi:hypothetical protein